MNDFRSMAGWSHHFDLPPEVVCRELATQDARGVWRPWSMDQDGLVRLTFGPFGEWSARVVVSDPPGRFVLESEEGTRMTITLEEDGRGGTTLKVVLEGSDEPIRPGYPWAFGLLCGDLNTEHPPVPGVVPGTDPYAGFVEHPRYGRGPRITGLNPSEGGGNHFSWQTRRANRVPNTAVAADLERQVASCIPFTHYFDAVRRCRDCMRPFLFFAEEQKHWYEELGFPLDSNCVRCVPCRKKLQGIALMRHRYEDLFHMSERTPEENLEMAECCLALIEGGQFTVRQIERVRMLLKRVPNRADNRYQSLLERLAAIESMRERQ